MDLRPQTADSGQPRRRRRAGQLNQVVRRPARPWLEGVLILRPDRRVEVERGTRHLHRLVR